MNINAMLRAAVMLMALFLLIRCDKPGDDRYPYSLRFITENFAPYNYEENGQLKGLAPDLLQEICRELNIPFEVGVLPWEQGYETALSTPGSVLFSTVLNADRRDQFKWAGPYASIQWHFFAPHDSPLSIHSLEDARQLESIGILADYSIEQYLLRQGFTNLVYCDSHEDAFTKLLNGQIQVYPSDELSARLALQNAGHSYYDTKKLWPILTDLIYFAFHADMPDEVVHDFQRVIDRTKADGTLNRLHQKYLNTAEFPGILQIYTEDYPPLSFMNSYGEISGFGTDIVKEIMVRNQQHYPIQLTSWSNAYELALNHPNFCLFTMDRTEIRDTLFQWVGPIGTNVTYFYVREDSGIVIQSLDDARQLESVGTVNSWFSDQYLRELGFTNLVSGSDPGVMTQMLMSGEIQAFVCSALTFPDILSAQGYSYEEVEEAFALMSSDFYISFSKSTPESLVNQWQQAFENIQADGTYQSVLQKWFPVK